MMVSLHNWTTDGMKIYCTKCNITYENITKGNTNNTNIINKFKLLKLKELTKNYCLDGREHNIVNDVC